MFPPKSWVLVGAQWVLMTLLNILTIKRKNVRIIKCGKNNSFDIFECSVIVEFF